MRVSYDKEADALAIWLEDAESQKTIDIAEDIFIDVDGNGRFVGLEILHASEKFDPADLVNISAESVDVEGIAEQSVRLLK